jgi:hypothetical protein
MRDAGRWSLLAGRWSLSLPVNFKHSRRPHSAADAHGHEPVTATAQSKLMDELRHQFRARRSQRMA